MKGVVIINEQHSLLPDQERVLNEEFIHGWETYLVPAAGWTYEEICEVADELEGSDVIFASPIPALLLILAGKRAGAKTFVLHNDHREKKELPGGKIIHTVSPTGWKIV